MINSFPTVQPSTCFPVPCSDLTAQTDLWVEEDLGSQEALVAHVNGELLLADGVDAGVLLDPLGAVRVVLLELFD